MQTKDGHTLPKTPHCQRFLWQWLALIGVLLITSSTLQGQITEIEAKHQKNLKDFSPIEVLPRFGEGRGCAWISNDPGTLFDSSENPIFQGAVIYGNPHWQYAHVSGTDALGNDFNGHESILRRFELGVRLHFLNYFTASISTDVEDDGKAKDDNSYDSLDYALYSSDIIFDAQDAFNWECYDQFQLRLGYFKVPSNAGWATSSNSMRAIERASLSNYSSPSDSLGAMISARRGRWDFDLGIFSGDEIDNGFDSERGSFWLGHIGYMFGKRERLDSLRTDLRVLVSNAPEKGETFQQDWVVSWSTVMRRQHWRMMSDFIIGENGDHNTPSQNGTYWGINIMPSVWLLEDRLEAIFRYQYVEADRRNGFRVSSHSIRRIADQEGAFINDGYGDKHQSLYAGLNYYICGDNTKIMAGVQWDDLTSRNKQVFEGLSTWFAVRLYF
ncbi:hypothetical protein HW115_12390 [Verrucomicrobiaceae bacterium N1E253]|uniref:Porin n=1 Tax=Oceaniferula marina TaxID=2748318 RepID=A0A851GQH8_9BACT|nr:porin [Oceaniferula marina]NWK56414.1 hypothetical protein [Oceaniferula marina]